MLERPYLLGTDHLFRDINFLLQRHDTLLQRAREVDLTQIVAEVGLLLDQGDQAILDLEENGSTWFDVFRESAVGDDLQLLATIDMSGYFSPRPQGSTYGTGGLGTRST